MTQYPQISSRNLLQNWKSRGRQSVVQLPPGTTPTRTPHPTSRIGGQFPFLSSGDSMAYYSTLRGYKFPGAEVIDIRGAAVYGPKSEKGERKPGEEKLGKIQDVIFDPGSGEIRYVVVDTGDIVLSKWFIIPGEAVSSSSKHENAYEVNLTRSEIEAFPRYDPELLTSP